MLVLKRIYHYWTYFSYAIFGEAGFSPSPVVFVDNPSPVVFLLKTTLARGRALSVRVACASLDDAFEANELLGLSHVDSDTAGSPSMLSSLKLPS